MKGQREHPDIYHLPSTGHPVGPRLLSLRQAAEYLGLSFWTVRDYVLAGYLPTVSLPALRPREGDRGKRSLRRVLIDRADLDAFVERQKQTPGIADTLRSENTE